MRRRRRVALGVATSALVLCNLTLLASLTVPWTTTDADGYESVGGYGPLLFYVSFYLGSLLTVALLVVYVVIVLGRADWSWSRRSLWALSFWVAAPLTMPTYFVRHVKGRSPLLSRHPAEQQSSQQRRRALSSAARFVSNYLDEWDPIPVYDGLNGPPPGEYDDLVWPVMRLLVDGAPAADIAAALRHGLQKSYGIPTPPDVLAVAVHLRDWWDAGAAESLS